MLGCVRIFQPVHGYEVRRELKSWRLDDWVNIQSGSVYSALRTLEKDRLIAVTSTSARDGRPARTEYEMTLEGDKEFQTMLRTAWWHVEASTEPLIPALCLSPFMNRSELAAALKSRISQIESQIEEFRFKRALIRDGATGAHGDTPEHVREIFDFVGTRLLAEAEWARTFERRLRGGEYTFSDEAAGAWSRPVDR